MATAPVSLTMENPPASIAHKLDDEEAPQANRAFQGEEAKDNGLLGYGAWGLNYLIPFNNCFILPERMKAVELFFGEYYGTITEPVSLTIVYL